MLKILSFLHQVPIAVRTARTMATSTDPKHLLPLYLNAQRHFFEIPFVKALSPKLAETLLNSRILEPSSAAKIIAEDCWSFRTISKEDPAIELARGGILFLLVTEPRVREFLHRTTGQDINHAKHYASSFSEELRAALMRTFIGADNLNLPLNSLNDIYYHDKLELMQQAVQAGRPLENYLPILALKPDELEALEAQLKQTPSTQINTTKCPYLQKLSQGKIASI